MVQVKEVVIRTSVVKLMDIVNCTQQNKCCGVLNSQITTLTLILTTVVGCNNITTLNYYYNEVACCCIVLHLLKLGTRMQWEFNCNPIFASTTDGDELCIQAFHILVLIGTRL